MSRRGGIGTSSWSSPANTEASPLRLSSARCSSSVRQRQMGSILSRNSSATASPASARSTMARSSARYALRRGPGTMPASMLIVSRQEQRCIDPSSAESGVPQRRDWTNCSGRGVRTAPPKRGSWNRHRKSSPRRVGLNLCPLPGGVGGLKFARATPEKQTSPRSRAKAAVERCRLIGQRSQRTFPRPNRGQASVSWCHSSEVFGIAHLRGNQGPADTKPQLASGSPYSSSSTSSPARAALAAAMTLSACNCGT